MRFAVHALRQCRGQIREFGQKWLPFEFFMSTGRHILTVETSLPPYKNSFAVFSPLPFLSSKNHLLPILCRILRSGELKSSATILFHQPG
jgi:hypothetical protein